MKTISSESPKSSLSFAAIKFLAMSTDHTLHRKDSPPKTEAAGAPMVDNPTYLPWYTQDLLILSALLSTLSPEVLSCTLGLTPSTQVWTAVERMFASRSRTHVTHIRRQLALIQKKGMSMED